MVRTRDRVSTRFRNPRGRGENDAIVYRGGAEVTIASFSSRPQGFLNRGETRSSCSNRLRTDDANRRSGMGSSRQAELAASGVISLGLLASLQDPFPDWLCPPQFKLGIGDDWEGPLAGIGFETTAEQDDFILEASQQLDAEGALSPNEFVIRRLDDAEVDELLLMASQEMESATEKAQPGTRIIFRPQPAPQLLRKKLDSELESATFVDKENKPMGPPSQCINFYLTVDLFQNL